MRTVITGVGIVSAIGNDSSEVLASLRNGESGIGTMRYLKSEHRELPVGEVKMSDDEMKVLLGVPRERLVSRTSLMGALAVKQAMKDAGITPDEGLRIALINGTTVGGMDITERYFSELKHDDTLLPILRKHDCGSSTKDIADLCGLSGETCTVSTACSSALNAVILGAEMLRSGEADIVIAGGSEALTKFHLNGFNTLMILDKERCRPFDESRAGLNLGEGAAFVVLAREGETQGRKRAYVSGYANTCDAFHQTASSEEGEGAYLAMSRALEMSGLNGEDIHYINAHGTGTPNNDSSESMAIKRVFGELLPPVSSTKSYTGHTTSASGAIELVISMLAMENGFIPSNLGWQHAMPDGILPSVGEVSRQIDNVMCNSFGFGGNDSSMIISRYALRDIPATDSGVETETVSESVISGLEQLQDSKDIISPRESRRMGKLLKAATLTSCRALAEAGVDSPDAIITATGLGMIENSELFLEDMCENGESLLKPTLFMQSTHNTIGSSIAIRLGCHGYNVTYSHGADSWAWALRDARRLIQSGCAESVLVGCHDESTQQIDEFCARMECKKRPDVFSRSVVIKRKR